MLESGMKIFFFSTLKLYICFDGKTFRWSYSRNKIKLYINFEKKSALKNVSCICKRYMKIGIKKKNKINTYSNAIDERHGKYSCIFYHRLLFNWQDKGAASKWDDGGRYGKTGKLNNDIVYHKQRLFFLFCSHTENSHTHNVWIWQRELFSVQVGHCIAFLPDINGYRFPFVLIIEFA